MPGILVATGFVRIDSDTKPAIKALKALGGIGGSALTTALGPATAAVTAGLLSVASAASVAAGAGAVYGAAVGLQFQKVSDAMAKQKTAEDASTKATDAKTVAMKLAKEGGFKYGEQVKITSKMSDEARRRAQEYNSALSQATSANKAAKLSQQAYKNELAQMPKPTANLVEALQSLKSSAKNWSDGLAGSTMPIFTRGVQFLERLLPKLTPIVRMTAKEVNDFVSTLGEGEAGKVFRLFGAHVTMDGAGALRSFLNVARNFTVGIVGVLNAFMPMSAGVTGGLEKMSAGFAHWGATLGQSGGFKTFTALARETGPKLIDLLKSLGRAFVDIASSAGPMAGVGLTLLTVFADLVDAIPTPVLRLLVPTIIAVNTAMKLYALYQSVATAATWAFSSANGASRASMALLRIQIFFVIAAQRAHAAATWLSTAATRAAGLAMVVFRGIMTGLRTAIMFTVGAFRALAVAMFTNPIGIVITAIVALAAAFFIAWKKSETFRNIVKGALSGIADAARAVGSWFAGPFLGFFKSIGAWFAGPFAGFFTKTIPAAFQTVINWAKSHWPYLLAVLTGPIGLAVVWIVRHWDMVRAGLATAWHAIYSTVVEPIVHFFTQTIPAAFQVVLNWVRSNWPYLVGALAGPFGLAAAAIYKNWDRIRSGLSAAWGAVLRTVVYPIRNFFTSTIPGYAARVRDQVVGRWRALQLGVYLAYVGLRNRVISPIRDFFTKTIPGYAGRVRDQVVGRWRALQLGVYLAFIGLRNRVITPIRDFFTKTIPGYAGRVRDQVVARWRSLREGVYLAFIGLRNRVIHPIRDFFTKTIPGYAGRVRDQVVSRWRSLREGIYLAYVGVRNRVIHPIRDFFTKTIPGYAGRVRDQVVSRWRSLREGLYSVYVGIRNRVIHPIRDFFTKTIPGWASTLRKRVVGFFGDMRDGVGRAWKGIQNKARTPINWVLKHVWNEGIVSVWRKITGWIGIGNKLKTVKLLAAGGTVGKAQPGMFSRPTAIVGEGNPRYPEYVIPTDPKYATRARGLWEAAGAHFYADGGILGTITGALSSAAGKAADFGKGALDFLSNPLSKAKKLLAGPLNRLGHIGRQPWAQMIAKLPHMAVDGLLKAVKKIGSSVLGAIGLGGGDGGAHGGSARAAQAIARALLPRYGWGASQMAPLIRLWNGESGWNYRALNRSSGAYGIPQSLPASKMASAGRDWRTNPATQIRWGLSYIKSRYGSPAGAYGAWLRRSPHWYASGGKLPTGYALGTAGASAGWHWVGENGAELAKLPSGTRIRTARQSARMSPGTATVHLTVENHGVIGSRQEVEDWLAGSIDTLRRKGRLPAALGGRP